jgi:hypothetical protein
MLYYLVLFNVGNPPDSCFVFVEEAFVLPPTFGSALRSLFLGYDLPDYFSKTEAEAFLPPAACERKASKPPGGPVLREDCLESFIGGRASADLSSYFVVSC